MLAAVVLAEVVALGSQQQMQFTGQQEALRQSRSASRPAMLPSPTPPPPPTPFPLPSVSLGQQPTGLRPGSQDRVTQTFQPQASWPGPAGLTASLLPSPQTTAKLGRNQPGCPWNLWSHLSTISPAKRDQERRGWRSIWNLTAKSCLPYGSRIWLRP